MKDLTQKIEKELEIIFGGFVLDGGVRERRATQAILKLFNDKMTDLELKIEELGHQQDDDSIWCNMDEVLKLIRSLSAPLK